MSDLLRAHEGNPDFKADNSLHIHWGKFSMIGKFIANTVQYQSQCKESDLYNFCENAQVRELLEVQHIMAVGRSGANPRLVGLNQMT